jgi:hypothetical protein
MHVLNPNALFIFNLHSGSANPSAFGPLISKGILQAPLDPLQPLLCPLFPISQGHVGHDAGTRLVIDEPVQQARFFGASWLPSEASRIPLLLHACQLYTVLSELDNWIQCLHDVFLRVVIAGVQVVPEVLYASYHILCLA